ncbi:DUF1707 domain-containing protein [Streptomyces sp. H10-C2]|uniref:DUF1707 domain-containing protein n=1 Tax=unclassified Streptomyces TaxID=2593676 RepID=UPI0024B90B25|nr:MULTISPECIES: DUF1707 domain-containing protein [unclassified Streptomyces]MDJ0342165.1 DUF1707 domain-containing protein [Streptomyces sp. PH10-H1]MDJ0368679.1 DUF1707 domain-containing protein [Streptomyces sp. H10-C2]
MSDTPAESRTTDVDLRASDQERDQTAAVLADALATGRLTTDEHSERLEATYAARTRGELTPITGDLPEPAAGTALVPPAGTEPVDALFSKIRRGGQWPVPPHTVAHARFGAVVLDLREAVFTRREVVIEAGSFCGKVEIVVPDNARVYDTGTALFGKRSQLGGDEKSKDDWDEDGTVVHITGRSVFGHVRVRRSYEHPWRDGR